jgi:pimeloyl-ACP methyl ester carboxylesterase
VPIAGELYYHFNQGVETSLPVVLLHGAGGMHLHWTPEMRRLPDCRLYALDLPGHGKSDEVGGLQTIAAYVERIQAWLSAVGLSRAVFIGHSMGGAIALEMALRYPEQVLGLGLVATGARLRVNPELLSNAANPTTFYKAIEMLVSWSFSAHAPSRLVELATKRFGEVRPSVLYGDLLACNAFDVSDSLGQVICPTLCVCGAEDRMTPLRNSQFLVGQIPHAQLLIIPEGGHMLMLEQPLAVAAAFSNFLPTIPF